MASTVTPKAERPRIEANSSIDRKAFAETIETYYGLFSNTIH